MYNPEKPQQFQFKTIEEEKKPIRKMGMKFQDALNYFSGQKNLVAVFFYITHTFTLPKHFCDFFINNMAQSVNLTIAELKEKLLQQGISFDHRAKKANLQALYDDMTNKGKEKEDAPKDYQWILRQGSAEVVQPYYEDSSVHNELAQLQWSVLSERFVKKN
ncbi:hypothetical protein QOT17_016718 [Balamuthia mandrillaris]